MLFRSNNEYYAKPLPVDMRRTSIFPWEHNPYSEKYSYVNYQYEEPGSIFTVPYWILRGFIEIPSEASK